MTTLQGKVAAVTGAGSGIGRALVVELVARGAHVAASDVDERGLRETAELARGETKVTTHRVDVRDRHAVERYAADVKAEHGGADVIINNAGVAVRASIAEISYEDFAFVLDVNLWGVVYGTKAFLPLFEERGAGHIVNISSVNGMVPFTKNSPYNVSKYGVLGFSETLMQEYRDRPIRTTVVHPGGIRTNIVRNARHAVPGEAETFDRIAMTSPAQAAKVILNGVEKNRERVYVGMDAKLMATAKRLFPALTVSAVGKASSRKPFVKPKKA